MFLEGLKPQPGVNSNNPIEKYISQVCGFPELCEAF